MKTTSTKSRKAPWLLWIGGTILFGSWLAQNYLQEERKSEIAYLSQAQLLISIEEGHFSGWVAIVLAEQSKDTPSQPLLKAAMLKAAQHQLNILTWATARVTDPNTHSTLLQDKSNFQKKLRDAYEKDDKSELSSLLGAMIQFANNEGPKLISAFSERYARARDAEEFWRRIFLAAYVAGSLLMCTSALRKWNHE